MISRQVTYEDFNGVERTETLWFNLTKTELQNLNFRHHGSYAEQLQGIVDSKDIRTIAELFEEIISRAYGIKSEDGRNFRKSQEILEDFKSSAAYDKLMSDLLESEDAAASLFVGALPKTLQEEVTKELKKKEA